MYSDVILAMHMKKRFLSCLLTCTALLLSACAPTLVSQTQVLPSPPRPMQRVVVVLNDDVYSHLFLHSSAMKYIHDLQDSIRREFGQNGMAVQIVETNSTDLSNGVARAVSQMKPTHILRLYVIEAKQNSRNMSLDEATWMFDVQQEDLSAMTTVIGQSAIKHVHRFKSIYRAEYAAPACTPMIIFPMSNKRVLTSWSVNS